MANGQQRRPVIPVIFIGAFATGALLWVLWMVVIVNKQRQIKPAEYYPQAVPAAGAASASNTPGSH